MLKQDQPKKDIPKDCMVDARIAFLEGRNRILEKEIVKNKEEIIKLEEFVDEKKQINPAGMHELFMG